MLAGFSYGGYIAQGIIHELKERVEGMVLIAPVVNAEQDKRDLPEQIVLERDESLLAELTKEELDEYEMIAVVQSRLSWERTKKEIIPAVKCADESFLTKLSETGYGYTHTLYENDIKFYCPCLFILGRQDGIVGFKDLWNIIDHYPRATYLVLDRAGHNILFEQMSLFNLALEEWLYRCFRELELNV